MFTKVGGWTDEEEGQGQVKEMSGDRRIVNLIKQKEKRKGRR